MLPDTFNIVISLLVFASAAACISFDLRGNRRGVYVFKPLTMVFVLAIAVQPGDEAFYRYALLLGLVLSLAGDVFLMLPDDRFVEGLGSFLLGHLCYIAAFSSGVGFGGPWAALLPFVAVGGIVLALILPAAGKQRGAVLAYVAVIAVMGWQATSRWLALDDTASALAFAGAGLFVFSDGVLAINRFRTPFPTSPIFVLGSYFGAQWLIALSIGVGAKLLG